MPCTVKSTANHQTGTFCSSQGRYKESISPVRIPTDPSPLFLPMYLELKIFLNILLAPVPFLGFLAPCVGQSSFWSQRTYFYNRIFGALQTYFLDPAGPIPTIVLPLYSPTLLKDKAIYSFTIFIHSFICAFFKRNL